MVKLGKIDTPGRKGAISDSNRYEDKISQVENPPLEVEKRYSLTEDEQSVKGSGRGEFMRLARIAGPGATYDAPAAARNFANSKPKNRNEEILNEENEAENDNEGAP